MNFGEKLRKIKENAIQEKLAKKEQIINKELEKHMNSGLGKSLEKVANDGLTRFSWNSSSGHQVSVSNGG